MTEIPTIARSDSRTEETCVKAWIQGDDVYIQMTMSYL